MMTLTADNYHSREANEDYMSASQLKAFLSCEARALAELRGEWECGESAALLVGSFVDAHFSGTLDVFKARHPQIFTRAGELKSDYRQAEEIIARIGRDELMTALLSGRAQEIRTGEIAGVPFKIKTDSLLDGAQCAAIAGRFPGMADTLMFAPGAIVDLKIMRDFARVWTRGAGYLHFIEAWRYDLQMAVYRHVEGHDLPCLIAAATKERVPDIAVYALAPERLDAALLLAEQMAPRCAALKRGESEPRACGACDYCKTHKRLEGPRDYEQEDEA